MQWKGGRDKEDSCAAYQKQRTTSVSSLKEQMKEQAGSREEVFTEENVGTWSGSVL